MKKIFLPIAICAALTFNANAVDAGDANIYASGLKVNASENENSVEFVLNATPTEVVVEFFNGEESVKKLTLTDCVKGKNTVSIDGLFEVAKDTELTWKVTAKAAAKTTYTGFCDAAISFAGGTTSYSGILGNVRVTQQMDYPCGIAVDNNPTSAYFGNIYVINSDNTTRTGARSLSNGVYCYNPLLEIQNPGENGVTAYSGNVSWTGGIGGSDNGTYANIPVSPFAISVDDEGFVFISDWSSNNAGVYMMDPANPESDFKTIIKKTNGNCSYVEGLCIVGKGTERKLYTIDESAKAIYMYAIGDLSNLPYTGTAEKICALNDYGIDVSRNTYLASDRRGGVWVVQRSATTTNSRGYFNLLHVTANGSVSKLNGENYVLEDYYGTNTYSTLSKHSINIASNPSGSEIAIGVYGAVGLKSVTFNEDGTVASLNDNSAKYILGYSGGSNTKTPINHHVMGVAYDVADNIYVADYSDFFQAYSFAKAENTYTTAANDKITVTDMMTGVESTLVDENAPVEYFNLQGVKVANPENGIFIKRQGAKATKVVL